MLNSGVAPLAGSLWIIFTVLAAAGQTLRNAMQKELTVTLGTVGATHIRFLFGLPFGLMFLLVIMAVTGKAPPPLNPQMLAWTVLGAVAQIGATALLLATMRERSFVITTAYTKTELIQVALFGLVFLGDNLTLGLLATILVSTCGVLLMSWPKGTGGQALSWHPALLGIASGALLALATVAYRGGIRALNSENFVLNASTTLVVGLLIQTALLTIYLFLGKRENLVAILRAWRPSLFAGFMGAFASQFWFLAFAIETAAKVRTLALIELLFAQLLTQRVFKQSVSTREALGIGLIVAGVILLLNQ